MFSVFSSDRCSVPLPPGHRFPMAKYVRLRQSLLERGLLAPSQIREPEPASPVQLGLAHDPGYVARVLSGGLSPEAQRRLGFPWSPELALRARVSVGGTLAAARAALRDGLAGNLAGGTHHAHAAHGSGYCTFNDVAVAARVLLQEGRIRRALVVDLDVHQGDGTARIFQDDPRVFTFSVHGARNFPFRKARSDLDVPLPDGTGDGAYLAALDRHWPRLLAEVGPDLVFYLAGVDPLRDDRLGRLSLTLDGLRARDARIVGACRAHSAPLVLLLGGGYARPLSQTIDAHCNTYRAVAGLTAAERGVKIKTIKSEFLRWA